MNKFFSWDIYLFRVTIIILFVTQTLADNPPTKTDKLVYLIPPIGLESEKLYDLDHPFRDRDDCLRYLVELRRALVNNNYKVIIGGYNMHFEKGAAIITSNVPSSLKNLYRLRRTEPKVLLSILTEPPSVYPQNYDNAYVYYIDALLTMDDKSIDNKKYFKFHFPQTTLKLNKKRVGFNEKKFCTMIVGNKSSHHPHELYSARRNTINFFSRYHPEKFDLYGKGWNKREHAAYRGGVSNKADVLPDYKFCICYENISSMKGYVTEKIFDALVNNCIPVYWGAPNITDYVPADCFIDRRKFNSDRALYDYLQSINESTYNRYLGAIEKFLASKQAHKFSLSSFNKSVLNVLAKKF